MWSLENPMSYTKINEQFGPQINLATSLAQLLCVVDQEKRDIWTWMASPRPSVVITMRSLISGIIWPTVLLTERAVPRSAIRGHSCVLERQLWVAARFRRSLS